MWEYYLYSATGHMAHTFSQSGSISVNKSRGLALTFCTSAPPAFPKIISPASLDERTAASRRESRVASGGSSISLVAEEDITVDAATTLGVRKAVRDDVGGEKARTSAKRKETTIITIIVVALVPSPSAME